ncbi:cytochrome c [Rappaport israeli]|uniref:cytochrome c n=1 Tax=Rappaport israeli TaxID=1839807 RepID=UPI000931BAE5|nr:cytochrome c [Rappaport israeli]
MKAKKLWLPLACLTLTLFTQAAEQSSKESSDKWSVDVYDSRDNHAWGGVYMSREDVGKKKGHIVDYSTIPDLETDATLQKWQQFFGEGNKFNERDGKAIYQHSCAGCHMHEGRVLLVLVIIRLWQIILKCSQRTIFIAL